MLLRRYTDDNSTPIDERVEYKLRANFPIATDEDEDDRRGRGFVGGPRTYYPEDYQEALEKLISA
jgi:hypothetical protein